MFLGDADGKIELRFVNLFKQCLFWIIHLVCIYAFWTGFSYIALLTCIFLYVVRMFGITAGYHRYFSHRSYKTSRAFQFILGLIGCSSAQKGPIWWASHHRHHHQHSDTEDDIHSPVVSGILYSHVGWVMDGQYSDTLNQKVKDLLKFPELRYLDRFHFLPPILLAVGTFYFGNILNYYFPSLGTSGMQMLIWGFFISTVLLYHGTFTINSLSHLIGKRRFNTKDDSRNNWFLAIITLGEGWHNNHHRYPGSERQGLYKREFDISHYILRVLSWFKIVWDLRFYPDRIVKEAQRLDQDSKLA